VGRRGRAARALRRGDVGPHAHAAHADLRLPVPARGTAELFRAGRRPDGAHARGARRRAPRRLRRRDHRALDGAPARPTPATRSSTPSTWKSSPSRR
jgi:hypothetical protein